MTTSSGCKQHGRDEEKVVRDHKRHPGSSLSHGKTPPIPLDPHLLDGLGLPGCHDGGDGRGWLHDDSLWMSCVDLLALDVLETWLGIALQQGNTLSCFSPKKKSFTAGVQ